MERGVVIGGVLIGISVVMSLALNAYSDYCPGDDELLSYVGPDDYRDASCSRADPTLAPTDVHNTGDQH